MYYELVSAMMLGENTEGAWPNSEYWTWQPNYPTDCVGLLTVNYTWEQMVDDEFVTLDYIEFEEYAVYMGTFDLTLEDECVPGYSRRICWAVPWILELPRLNEVCTNVTMTGGDPKLWKAYIIKLGQYLPQPDSVQIKVILRTWIQNPYKLVAEGVKVRPNDDLVANGLETSALSVEVVDIEQCDFSETEEYCVQDITMIWDLNYMCDIAGYYWADVVLRAHDNPASDVTVPLLLELGLDPACGEVIGTINLAGDLLSYSDEERESYTRMFSVWEMAYFSTVVESHADIGFSNVTEIKLVQDGQENIVFSNGEATGWGLDPEFFFSFTPTDDPTQVDFSFMLDPQFITAIDVGAELDVCVTLEVLYTEAERDTTRRFVLTSGGEIDQKLQIDQPVYVLSDGRDYGVEGSIIETQSQSSNSVPMWIIVVMAGLSGLLCLVLGGCTYKLLTMPKASTETSISSNNITTPKPKLGASSVKRSPGTRSRLRRKPTVTKSATSPISSNNTKKRTIQSTVNVGLDSTQI